MLDLYKNIKLYRKKLGITQDELARRAGYTDRSSIAKIEKGVVDLPQSKIELFAGIFGVSAGELMGRDGITEEIGAQNDLIASVVIRMRTDQQFAAAVEKLYNMDAEKVAGVSAMLAAFEK